MKFEVSKFAQSIDPRHSTFGLRQVALTAVALLACAQTTTPLLAANPQPAKGSKQKDSEQKSSEHKGSEQIAAIRAIQQHHALGKGELYSAGLNVKYVFNNGDIVVLYRGEEHKVYFCCPDKKAVYESNIEQFRKRGITFTNTGRSPRDLAALRDDKHQIVFQKIPAKTYTICDRIPLKNGTVKLHDVGSMTTLSQPTKIPEAAEFVAISYGVPLTPALPLAVTTYFYVEDGTLWFKTNTRDLPKVAQTSNYSRLRTLKLENVKVASNFFDAPKGFKKYKTQEEIFGLTSATKDFTDLMFAQ